MANANNLGLTPEQLARLTVVDHPLVQHRLGSSISTLPSPSSS